MNVLLLGVLAVLVVVLVWDDLFPDERRRS